MKLQLNIPNTKYRLKDTLKGNCIWDTHSSKPPKWVLVSLILFIEGECNPDIIVVEQQNLNVTSSSGLQEFVFTLPEFPWSYDGKLFRVHWAVEAVLDTKKVDRVDIKILP